MNKLVSFTFPLILVAISPCPALAHTGSHAGHMHHGMGMGMDVSFDSSRPQALEGDSIYNLDSSWTTQDGKKVLLSSLRGAPTVVAMIYTSCPDACPMTISDLLRIEDGLPKAARKEVRFAIFSFDSERDTPEVLSRFARAHRLDLSHWTLFHGDPASVRKLAAVLGIRYKRNKNGDFEHSNVITVLDSGGVIQYQQVGLKQDPNEAIAKVQEARPGKR